MKFKFLISILAAAALLGACFTANAGLISGTMSTDGGKIVALQGLEWLSLEHTAGMSRADVENGFTDNYGTTWDAGEWAYASRSQTEILINSLWGGVYNGWSNDNADGASWFITNFGGISGDTWTNGVRTDGKLNNASHTNLDYSNFLFGNDGDCYSAASFSCLGLVITSANYTQSLDSFDVHTATDSPAYVANSGRLGYFKEEYGASMGIFSNNNRQSNTIARQDMGSLLVRNTATDVPEPSTLAIFVLSIIGLASRRFKKQSKIY